MSDETVNKWEDLSNEHNNSGSEATTEPNLEVDEEQSEAEGALEHPDYQALQVQLTKAEQTAHDNHEKALRAQAELENVRRRAERDVESAHKFGQEKLIDAILPVIDSLEQALEAAAGDDSQQGMREGIELTYQLFLSNLEKFKVTQLNPVGEAFDPNCHEAMSMLPSADHKPGAVMQVIQKGYLLNERVIRAARVIVAKE